MNVLLCGLGAIGSIYAHKLSNISNIDFRVLVDETRLNFYTENPTFFNDEKLNLKFILPNDSFSADIIIIATKFEALNDVINNLENFVNKNTIFLSLINGISSEKIIAERYGAENIVLSYYIGHSAERVNRNIFHDGVNKIVFGSQQPNNQNIDKLKSFFENAGINYEVPVDIIHSVWSKFMVNVALNQTTALYKMSVGQMRENPTAFEFFNNLMNEVEQIAVAEKVNNPYDLRLEVLEFVNSMPYDSKTSMLQDVLAGRKPEFDIFAKTIIELGKKHGISTPYNQRVITELI